jgi:hypothetical protein
MMVGQVNCHANLKVVRVEVFEVRYHKAIQVRHEAMGCDAGE